MTTYNKIVGIPSGGGVPGAISSTDNLDLSADALTLVFGATGAGSFTLRKGLETFLTVSSEGEVRIGNATTHPPVVFPGTGTVRMAGSLTVAGNLTVQGSTTTVQSTVVDLADRVIHLNHSTGADVEVPSSITGIAVRRGSSGGVARDHSALVWDEASALWKFALNTAGDDTTLGAYQSVKMRSLELESSDSTLSGGSVSVRVENIGDTSAPRTVTGGWTFGGRPTTHTADLRLHGGNILTQTGGVGDLGESRTRLNKAWLTDLDSLTATVGTLTVGTLNVSSLEAGTYLHLHAPGGVTTNVSMEAGEELAAHACVTVNAGGALVEAVASVPNMLVMGVTVAAVRAGTSSQNKVAEFGCVHLLLETGVEVQTRDMLYLSSIEKGRVTPVAPAEGATVYLVGKALSPSSGSPVRAMLHRQFLYNS